MNALVSARSAFSCLLLVVCMLLLGCSTPQQEQAVVPEKSPNDDNAYRLVTLDNGLQALLISDSDAPKAAAALDVLVGHGENPDGRGGLAHFLEHMLFLGTEKYPDAAEYERFITEHGGSRNAFTSFEHTNYFFDINAEHLRGGLDRFAQFFIAPNFDALYVDRERNAVEAEYQMGLKSDGRRGLAVLQASMNPDHPFHRFAVGSQESLADQPGSDVRDELVRFYKKHYSADVMRLAVLGRESLDDLEILVRELFAEVPNRDVTPAIIDEPMFVDAQLPMLLKVEPTGTSQQLSVNFEIGDYRDQYRAKPLSYLGYLVGHEGEGSLLSLLKAEGLAEGLSAGEGIAWRGGTLFSVNVSLTDRGVEEYERVLQALFAYLDMLREAGPVERLYEEQSALSEMAFRFREPAAPIRTVMSLAGAMHSYADEDILRGPYLMERFAPNLISEALAGMTPERAQVVLTAPGVETRSVTGYYQVPYTQLGPEAIMLAQWRAPAGELALHLPEPNPFIPEDLTLEAIAADNPATPALVFEAPRKRIWYRQAEEFRVPKGALYVSFRSPYAGASAEDKAAASLYTRIVTDALNEFTYPAVLAGLGFDFYRHAQGISLRVSGYDDKQLRLLEQLLAAIEAQSFDAERFERVRNDMLRELRNTAAQRPTSQLLGDLRQALTSGEYSEDALIEALEGMDRPGLQRYRDRFWNSVRAEALLYGNHPDSAVDRLAVILDKVLPEGPGEPALAPEILKLEAGDSLLLSSAIDHDDAVVAWYLQGAETSMAERAALALTSQIMQSGFFQQLRTEQQLGYVVQNFAWNQYEVPGLMMLIQSPTHDARVVQRAMADFLEQLPGDIDEAQFLRHRQALVSDILKPHENLGERAGFYWQSIAAREWNFDQPQRMADAVAAIDFGSWQEFFRQRLLGQPLSLIAASAGKREALPVYRDADQFGDPAALRAAQGDVYEVDLAPL